MAAFTLPGRRPVFMKGTGLRAGIFSSALASMAASRQASDHIHYGSAKPGLLRFVRGRGRASPRAIRYSRSTPVVPGAVRYAPSTLGLFHSPAAGRTPPTRRRSGARIGQTRKLRLRNPLSSRRERSGYVSAAHLTVTVGATETFLHAPAWGPGRLAVSESSSPTILRAAEGLPVFCTGPRIFSRVPYRHVAWGIWSPGSASTTTFPSPAYHLPRGWVDCSRPRDRRSVLRERVPGGRARVCRSVWRSVLGRTTCPDGPGDVRGPVSMSPPRLEALVAYARGPRLHVGRPRGHSFGATRCCKNPPEPVRPKSRVETGFWSSRVPDPSSGRGTLDAYGLRCPGRIDGVP